MIALILTLFTSPAFAKDTWLCTDEGSQSRGEHVYACGVGTAVSEEAARDRSFDAAEVEFLKICRLNASCWHHKTTAVSQRITCDQINRYQWKCYRLLLYTIQPETYGQDVANE